MENISVIIIPSEDAGTDSCSSTVNPANLQPESCAHHFVWQAAELTKQIQVWSILFPFRQAGQMSHSKETRLSHVRKRAWIDELCTPEHDSTDGQHNDQGDFLTYPVAGVGPVSQ